MKLKLHDGHLLMNSSRYVRPVAASLFAIGGVPSWTWPAYGWMYFSWTAAACSGVSFEPEEVSTELVQNMLVSELGAD